MLDLSKFDYVNITQLTGNIEDDAISFLKENNKHKIAGHVLEVAEVAEELAAQFRLDSYIARTAAILHDISGVLKTDDMMAYALNSKWWIDESEKKYPFLLHQRISCNIAKDIFGIENKTILSMIECHTTLKDNANDYDILLFLADKLAWDQEGTPPYYNYVQQALCTSLIYAAKEYIHYVLNNNLILYPHAWLIAAKDYLQVKC